MRCITKTLCNLATNLHDVLMSDNIVSVFTAQCVCIAWTMPWQDVYLSVSLSCHMPVLCRNAVFNDFEQPVTRFPRSSYSLMLNIS